MSTSQDVEKVQESGIRKKKSLFRNWPLMSSIIVYCIFSFHDMAYTEVFAFCLFVSYGTEVSELNLSFLFCFCVTLFV